MRNNLVPCTLLLIIVINFWVSVSSPVDIEICMENEECGIKSYGSFILNNDTSGHIYEIKNGLMYNVIFYWDIIYKDFGINNKSNNHKKPIHVPSMSYRYIDSEIHESHIVRLFIKIDNEYEMIDKSIGHETKKLASKKSHICDYLFRLCYFNKKYQEEDNAINNTLLQISSDNKCAEYESTCSQFFLKTEEDLCVDTCITTYYGHLLNDKEKISPTFDRINLVQCMIENQNTATSGAPYTNIYKNSGIVKTKSDIPEKQQLETTITVLAVLFSLSLLFIVVVVFFWAREKYREYYYKKGSMVLDQTDTETTTGFV